MPQVMKVCHVVMDNGVIVPQVPTVLLDSIRALHVLGNKVTAIKLFRTYVKPPIDAYKDYNGPNYHNKDETVYDLKTSKDYCDWIGQMETAEFKDHLNSIAGF